MNWTLLKSALFFLLVTLLGTGPRADAQTYIHANGGSYWSQTGTGWHSISNDGYCVSGRGPCGSNLWYLQWHYNYFGCGYSATGSYSMAAVLPYNGSTYAWIDSSTGNMYGADYSVAYNYASGYAATVDQSAYFEAWAPIALSLYRTSNVQESDAWGANYACNGVSGLQVEFDEVKLQI